MSNPPAHSSSTVPTDRCCWRLRTARVVGHSAVCTHQQCTIAASGSCPCHGSKFNITTGAVENGPAQRPLDEIAVTVSGGQVYSELIWIDICGWSVAGDVVRAHSNSTAST